MKMFFDIKTLYWLLYQDRFYNNKGEHEPEEENTLLDTIEAATDSEARDNIESQYIECKNVLLELGFIDGFRMAVALILDNGKDTPYDKIIKAAKVKTKKREAE